MCFLITLVILSLLLLILIPLYLIENVSCGIFYVDYTYGNSVNIGDYIQSIAAMQFCKAKQTIYIERDSINKYRGKKIKVIMNAWWRINKMNMIPSNKINPLYISYHLDNPESITLDYLNHLKKYEPIGCRDVNTANTLNKMGIKSYFSGCLTLTLGNTYSNNYLPTSKVIYFSDCPLCDRYKEFILNYIKNITSYSNYTIIKINHEYSKSITHQNRFSLADNTLRKYQSAFLVLTSRLHACLPCLAMNTSVILIRNNLDNRFTGLIDFTNYMIFNSTKPYTRVVQKNGNIINPNNYLNYSSKLEKTVKDFLLYT